MASKKSPVARKSARTPTSPAAKKVPASKAVAKTASDAPPREPGKISAKQALANTLALLKAKRDKTRQPANYPTGQPVHPGAQGPHGVAAPQPEHAPTERLTEAIHGHAYATETGDESKRNQS